MPPVSLGQTCDKPLCHHKHVSFLGCGQCESLLLFFCPMATHYQMYPEPAMIAVPSTMDSETLFLFGDILLGRYLSPLPDCNVASLGNMQKKKQCFGYISIRQDKKVQIQ